MELLTVLLAAGLLAADSPFACDRTALTPVERKRHFDEVTPALRKLVKGMAELPEGFAFELQGDTRTIQLAAEWVARERLCCPFLEINLKLERERGKIWVQLTGRPGTKEFIQAAFGSWF